MAVYFLATVADQDLEPLLLALLPPLAAPTATYGSGTDMSIAIKDGSTWRYPRSIEVKDGGTWRTAKTLSYKDGSTWRVLVNFIGAAVVGSDGSSIYGYTQNPYGSLTPSTDINSYSISA